MSNICPNCNRPYDQVVDCEHCTYRHDPNEPDTYQVLDFNKDIQTEYVPEVAEE